ncbi:MAG: hypothetical protein A3H96_13490 [Acidobacteria bacterium RIFCSPLOWO2_02_FULL_67_36]|nr:MAG: hypothetical protein A3H96_13490 [Acidobacteria bacterium RIFCSPLOWO2_02_FULL_67_36]
MSRQETRAALLFALSLVPFILLCAVNSAGYRYGASDQAFYVPAVLARLDPSLFPRDGALIASQAHLTLIDETVAALARATGATLPVLLAWLYAGSLALLAGAAWLIARSLYRSRWTALALLAALTLRHAIWRTGTNSLEGYFHPRQLAFGFGALAIAALLRGRLLGAAALVAVAAMLHPTTALWFAVWIAVAASINWARGGRSRRWWRVATAAALAAVAVLWLVVAGPLAGRLVRMDPEWLATLVTKDYLFPLDWPILVWAINLAYIPIILFVYRYRVMAGAVTEPEPALVAGCLSLAIIFGAALPFNAARLALAVQLQIPRVFWMLDLLATVYVVWALAEGARPTTRRAQWVAAIVVVASIARGGFVMLVGFPERAVARIDVRDDDWGRTMAWARTTRAHSGWIADPLHAIKYGTSVRVAGARDVLVEGVKDAAIGMYDRAVAMRTRDRLLALGDFDRLTADRARQLGADYDLDFLVTEAPLDLPLAFESGTLRVYRLR